MAIRIRYEAAGVPISEAGVSSAKRKYGQDLVMQQRKYDLETKQLQQQQGFQAQRDAAQQNFILGRDKNQQDFVLGRDAEARRENALAQQEARERQKTALEEQRRFQQGQQAEAQRRRAEEEAIMAKRASLRDGMENGEFGDVNGPVVKRLKELDLALMDARAGKSKDGRLDASQQAEAIQKIEAEVEALAKNRLPRKAPPTADDQIRARTSSDGKRRIKANGDIEEVPQDQSQGPRSAEEAFRDPKTRDYFMGLGQRGEDPTKPLTPAELMKRAREAYDAYQQEFGGGAAPAQPGLAPGVPMGGPRGAMAAPPVAQPAVPGQPPQVGQQVAQAPAAAVPNIEPEYSADGESQKKIVPVHDPEEQKWIDGGFVQVRDSELPIGFSPPVTFKGPKGEPVHYFDPKDMPDAMSDASQQSIVADSGLTDEQFKAAMEQQFNNMGGAQPNQDSAQPAVPFSEQQFQNNVPVVGPNGASGQLNPSGGSGVMTPLNPQPNRMQIQAEQTLRNAAPVVPDGTLAAPASPPMAMNAEPLAAPVVPAVSPEVGKFFDSKIAVAKNADEKLKYSAIQSFVAKGQSPEVSNALMVSMDDKATKQDKLNALQFLLSKGVSISEIVKRAPPKELSKQGHGYRPPGSRY